MIFASFLFVFAFLPLFLAAYYALPRRARNGFLALASYVFYGWWRPDFVVLMWISTVVDFVCANRVADTSNPRRKIWLLISLATNLGLLAYFKYANLLVETIELATSGDLGWDDVVLPVGISFYTFQSLSYTIDVYRGEAKPVRSFTDLACFVSMFPQLVAGPIVRYRDIAGELANRRHTFRAFAAGTLLFQLGFAKKILLADNAALIADAVFNNATPGLVQAWLGLTAYALQIYFDFSGYSDMAVGLGLMVGFHLPKNFDSPYRSLSITEFWRRWHISLSSWLRDYVYVPLGGNRRGEVRTYVNLMLTMLIGGLWHGAAWTFVLWGAYQGFFLVVERLAGRRPIYHFLPRPLAAAVTFAIVLGGWALFRAEGMDGLAAIYGGMFGWHGIGQLPDPGFYSADAWLALAAGLTIVHACPQAEHLVASSGRGRVFGLGGILFLVALCQLAAREFTPFIYFQF